MNLEDLKDKAITIIVYNIEKENDVHVYLGKLRIENDEHYFVNEEKGWRISLEKEQLSRLKLVSSELKDMLFNADYAISLSIGELPQPDSAEYEATGMKWHI